MKEKNTTKEKIPRESLVIIISIAICFIFTCSIIFYNELKIPYEPTTNIETTGTFEDNVKFEPYLPENALHPVSNTNNGYYNGPSGIESYYRIFEDFTVPKMRELGYSEKEYPYWVRDDGVQMFGDYVMVAMNEPYGTIIETSLGKGMVCDLFGDASLNRDLDIATIWY